MEPGSVAEVAARLKLWCSQRHSGLARVEFDSVYARRDVISLLRATQPVAEIEVHWDTAPSKSVDSLLAQLESLPAGRIVSITGISGIFPDPKRRLEIFAALSFQRERLASLPLNQIWWIPSHLIEQFILGVPDLDSWFQLRLHLTEIPAPYYPEPVHIERTAPRSLDVAQARDLNEYFWQRSTEARERGVPTIDIWTSLGAPVYYALRDFGLTDDMRRIVGAFPDLENSIGDEFYQSAAPSYIRSLLRFAQALHDTGDYNRARRIQERVLEARIKALGPSHPDTLTAASGLARTLYAQRDLAAARTLQEQVLAERLRLLGDKDPATLRAMENLAVTLRAQRQLPQARQLVEQALVKRSQSLGEEHPDVLLAMNNLASILYDQGDLDGARQLVEKVYKVGARVLGDDHPITQTARENLAQPLSKS